MTRAVAAQLLARDSLTLGSVVVSDTGDAPVVVAQRPAANAPAYFYDPVSITVASPRVVLPPPNLSGTSPAAPTTLAPPPVATPPVSAAPPAPPRPAPPSIPLIAVPTVTNMAFEVARRLIDSVGLTTVSTATGPGTSFVVRSQRPAPGSLVPFGAQVILALDSLVIRSVPHLVGLKRAAAEEHASADGFTMSIQKRRRALLQLFEQVATQESDLLTIARGDQRIEVDLATPLIPPLPAGIALVLAAAGTAMKVRSKRAPRGKGRPLTDLNIVLEMAPAAPPTPSPIPNDRVIRTAITFELDSGRGEWTVESEANSLISHIETHG
jgi:beta-lactam-binding protein with PASTA domain